MELSVDQIKRIVEASLLMNREPQTAKKIAELFTPEENITERAVVDTLTLLTEDYRGRGVELVEVATGYRFQVCADLSPWIQRTMTEKPQRYSRALLETLALIAYRQPITRAEIEEIRGVVVSTQIMRTLEEREWVRVIGHRDVPGRPALYATTKQFLNDLNLKSLGELPTLAELQDLDKVDGEFQQMNLPISDATPESSESQQPESPATELNENNEMQPVLNVTEEVQQTEEQSESSEEEITHNEESNAETISAEQEDDEMEDNPTLEIISLANDETEDENDVSKASEYQEEGLNQESLLLETELSEVSISLVIDDSEEENNMSILPDTRESELKDVLQNEMHDEATELNAIDNREETDVTQADTVDYEKNGWEWSDSLSGAEDDFSELSASDETDLEQIRKQPSEENQREELLESVLELEETE